MDPQNSTIEPWNEGPNSRTKPLRLESTMPTGKQKIDKKYVEQLKISWAASNTATELRFILGHMKPIQTYLTNKEVGKELTDFEAEVFVDRIQSEKGPLQDIWRDPLSPIGRLKSYLIFSLKTSPLRTIKYHKSKFMKNKLPPSIMGTIRPKK